MHIVILTSQQNFVWHSMQEIIPYIEDTWIRTEGPNQKVTILNVDNLKMSQMLPILLQATHIVLSCFNFKVFKVACFIRENLKLQVNFIIYVHNMATIAFWPFKKWSATDFFKKNDVFISSCENDRRTLNAVFEKPQVIVIPFYFLNPDISFLNKSFTTVTQLVYVGRISPQKNLHNLILGYSLAKKNLPLPKLTFFGKEDNLGSPNMNLKQSGYQQFLDNLVKSLNLQNDVIFRGHQSRENINSFLMDNNCLTISPSLHSDENFGMAVLQSLILGNHCLISDWGGHSDFKKYFENRVTLMHVNQSQWGPSLSAEAIANSLHHVWSNGLNREHIKINTYYTFKNHIADLVPYLNKPYQNQDLKLSPLGLQIHWQKFNQYPDKEMQIFSDYTDKLFHQISSFYIGDEPIAKNNFENSRLTYVPWLQNTNNSFIISDPHKGAYNGISAFDNNILNKLNDGGYLISEN